MTFTPEVYAEIRDGAQRSAAVVAPLIYRDFQPGSVIDVGGGEGLWASQFAECGCQAVVVDESVKEPHFVQYDYEGGGRVTFYPGDLSASQHVPDVDKTFDLALCLEVAEHLPAEAAAPLVAWLVARAPVIVFSAAIPGQGGHGHLNEQWPAYWAELFEQHGYSGTDYLRWEIWNDDRVESWYRQNLLVFATVETLERKLRRRSWDLGTPPVVHPVIWEHRRQR